MAKRSLAEGEKLEINSLLGLATDAVGRQENNRQQHPNSSLCVLWPTRFRLQGRDLGQNDRVIRPSNCALTSSSLSFKPPGNVTPVRKGANFRIFLLIEPLEEEFLEERDSGRRFIVTCGGTAGRHQMARGLTLLPGVTYGFDSS